MTSCSHMNNRIIKAITSGPQTSKREIKCVKTSTNQTGTSGIIANFQLNARLDTSCAGANCRPLYFTGQQCNVFGFHRELTSLKDVPIASVATAWTDNIIGQTYILIFNEVLYFGPSLDYSLLNPNQVRHYGVKVCDNPYETDPDHAMGIHLDDRLHFPFVTNGSTVFMEYIIPPMMNYRNTVTQS